MSSLDSRPLIKVLAIDGGGARGVIPARLLDAIERGTGETLGRERVHAHELFDVISGTSTGSLIAAMLTVPKPDSDDIAWASEIEDFYMGEKGRKFFQRSEEYADRAAKMDVPSYPAESHIAGFQAAINTQTMLSEARTNLSITIYNLVDAPPRTYTFTRWKARHGRDDSPPGDHEFPMWKVIRAASTFPGIWPGWTLESANGVAYHPLDGGMFAINPVLEGLAHAIRLLSRRELGSDYRFLVVSLGTGFFNIDMDPGETRQWGAAQWFTGASAPPVVQVLFEGQTDGADLLMNDIQSRRGRIRHYHRFQPEMQRNFQLDDVDATSLETLRGYADDLLQRRRSDLDSICRLLAEGRGLPSEGYSAAHE